MLITPVILSGGGGTRLWPMSTPVMPKQFLALTAEQTMFQLTVGRVADRTRFAPPIIVANAAHADLVKAQLDAIGATDATIILEPCPRNTAPAIALAALAAIEPVSPLLVMPSDHVILDGDAFSAATDAMGPLVADGWLATYGITPTCAATGYGYIQTGTEQSAGVYSVQHFVEKPEASRAAEMAADGSYLWNSGIFLFRADIYLDTLALHDPAMLKAVQAAMTTARRDPAYIHPGEAAFASSPADSIDYAVMEKADRVAVAPVAMGWSDIGSWDSLYDILAKDDRDNVVQGDARLSEARNNLVHTADGIRVSIHGVSDLIVVANGREVMILPRGSSQKVRDFAS